jgi:hypothetical protein
MIISFRDKRTRMFFDGERVDDFVSLLSLPERSFSYSSSWHLSSAS